MTPQDFINKYLGQTKGYPDDSQYLGQCLSIVKLYIKDVFGINPPPSGTNSAYGYWSNFPDPLDTVFERVLNTTDLIPEYGCIAIWKPWTSNPYGHIAIVDKDCTQTVLKNLAQNWTSKVFQRESQNYNNVIGFLKPKGEIMTEEQKRILDFIGGRTEGEVRAAFGALADHPNIIKEIADLKLYQKDLESKISELVRELDLSQKSEASCQKSLKSANIENQRMITDLAYYKPYKSLYEAALKKTVDKFTKWELFQLLFK